MRLGRSLLVLAMAILIIVVLAPAAVAGASGFGRDTVILTGTIHVAEGEVYDTVVVFDGPAIIDGRVNNVIAFNGDVTVNGFVRDTVMAFNGHAMVEHGAIVEGDVYSRIRPMVAQNATVEGTTGTWDPEMFVAPSMFVTKFAFWLAVSLSTLVLGAMFLLLGPRAADGAVPTAKASLPESIGVGLLAVVGIPIFALVSIATLVGLPLGLGLMAALALIYAVGYVAGAWILGRIIVTQQKGRTAAFLAGWAILRLVALVPVLGGFVWFATTVVGLGAILVEAWRAREARPVTQAAPAAG